jgi:hypothetical protein
LFRKGVRVQGNIEGCMEVMAGTEEEEEEEEEEEQEQEEE